MEHLFGILDVSEMDKYDMSKYSTNGFLRYNVDKTKVLVRMKCESDIIPGINIYTMNRIEEILKKSDWKKKLF
jgi:hypothetical protein